MQHDSGVVLYSETRLYGAKTATDSLDLGLLVLLILNYFFNIQNFHMRRLGPRRYHGDTYQLARN
jgi:hypothetical protein